MNRALTVFAAVILLSVATFLGVPLLGYSLTYWHWVLE